jgi:hypothetical protein
MKFFVPYAENDAQSWRVLDAACKLNAVPVPRRKIHRIEYIHDGMSLAAEVGKPMDRHYGEKNQVVLVIVGSDPYLVCLANRGVLRGKPIPVGKQEVRNIEYFD